MENNKYAVAYTSVYTITLAVIAVLTFDNYVFVPNIPFFFLCIIPLFVIQASVLRKYSQNKFFKSIYIANVVISCTLIVGIKSIVCTQYFAIYHFLAVLLNCTEFSKKLLTAGSSITSLLLRVVSTSVESEENIVTTIMALLLSSAITITSIIAPYPYIQDQGGFIKFGLPRDKEFTTSDCFKITDTIPVGIGVFMQVGQFYHEIG